MVQLCVLALWCVLSGSCMCDAANAGRSKRIRDFGTASALESQGNKNNYLLCGATSPLLETPRRCSAFFTMVVGIDRL